MHFAFSVTEADYAYTVATLRGRGVTVDKVEFGPGNARSAYVTDPDGHVVEFWTRDVSKGGAGAPKALSPNVYGVS